jgi:hypothetical protein
MERRLRTGSTSTSRPRKRRYLEPGAHVLRPGAVSGTGLQRPPTKEQEHAFAQRLHDLATQSMSAQPDLLGEYRDHGTGHAKMP